MPKNDESGFLNSVFPAGEDPPVGEAAPADLAEEEAEKPDPREAYLPNVVGPRIRNALGGGQGLGSSRRYGMIVALLVGLASLPSWIVLRSGVDEILPAERMTSGAVLRQPLPEMPLVVSAPQARTRHLTQVEAEVLIRPPVTPARPVTPPRAPIIVEHGQGPGPQRPIAKPKRPVAKPKKPKKVVRKTRPGAVVPPVSRPSLPKPQRPCGHDRHVPRRAASHRGHRRPSHRVPRQPQHQAREQVQQRLDRLRLDRQRQMRQRFAEQVERQVHQQVGRHSQGGVG